MKSLVIFLLCFSASAFCIQHFWRGDTMSAKEAEKRWGKIEFNAEKFKNSDLKVRSLMAASIQENEKLFKGKSVLEIRELLGPTDGFYFSDVYPTYLIQVGKNHSEETWQLVFLLNNKRNVEKVIIHKNCCD